jgi:hypothetical protein
VKERTGHVTFPGCVQSIIVRKKVSRDQSAKVLTGEYRIGQIPEMWITGNDHMAPGPGCGEDDRIGNPTFESLVPEFTGKDCNGFCYRENKAPDANPGNDRPDILQILTLLVKELNHLRERDR